MTIVSSGNQRTLEQIEKQLNKKLDIIKVRTFHEEQSISRELMLIKVKYNRTNRKDIMEVCSILKAEIVDMSKSFMMIQICAEPERIQLPVSYTHLDRLYGCNISAWYPFYPDPDNITGTGGQQHRW